MHTFAELLHIGVLVGRALVAVNGDALMHDVAIEILFLAERLHDELLQVFGEQHETVLIRQHDHVFGSLAVSGEIPHESEQCGWVLRRLS